MSVTPYYQDASVTLYHGRWEDVLPTLADQAVDAVITDPPYGYDVDKRTPWDRPVDVHAFTCEVRRLAREFYAVFGQMPTVAAWHQAAAEHRLHFCEHVVWIKRNCTPSHRLKRGHESIYIYATGRRRQFYETTGPYEDVKVPGVLVDAISLEGIQGYIADLHRRLQGEANTYIRGKAGNRAFMRYAPDHRINRSPRCVNYTNVWSFLPPGHRVRDGRYGHVAAKPLAIMDRLVRMLTAPDGLVLDPFAGSGTTLVAARAAGRRAIGVELHEEFCAMAVRRLSQSPMPLPLQEGAA